MRQRGEKRERERGRDETERKKERALEIERYGTVIIGGMKPGEGVMTG